MSDEPKRMLDGVLGRKNAGRSEVILAAFPPVSFPPFVTLCDARGSDDKAEMVTVYLDSTPSDAEVGPATDFRPYMVAQIEWGQDGYQSQAEVDFVRGTALSVACSYLRVKAGLDAAAFLNVNPAPSAPIRAAAHFSYGTRPGGWGAPTRTLWFRLRPADGAASPTQEIPRFAKTATLIFSDPTLPLPPYQIQLLDSASVVIMVRWANQAFGGSSEAFPIPADARLVRVINPVGAVGPQDFRVVFNLAF